jgi:hypothetical protein
MPPALASTVPTVAATALVAAVVLAHAARAEPASPAPAPDAATHAVIDGRHLALPLPHGVALELTWTTRPERAADGGEAAAPTAPPEPPRRAVTSEREPAVARFLESLPVRIQGGDAVFAPEAWSVRVGRGATASSDAARADLSATRVVTSAALTRAGGNVELARDGATVGEVFAAPNGLGHRPRARLDVALDPGARAALAASVAADGDGDLALSYRGGLGGWRSEARLAAMVDRKAGGRALRVEGSAALREPRSGFDLTLAASGGDTAAGARRPATVYAKLARARDADRPIAGAWSLDAAWARDVDRPGDRAWLAGATWLQTLQGVGRVHLRYRYHRLERTDGRSGQAHAILVGGRLRL